MGYISISPQQEFFGTPARIFSRARISIKPPDKDFLSLKSFNPLARSPILSSLLLM